MLVKLCATFSTSDFTEMLMTAQQIHDNTLGASNSLMHRTKSQLRNHSKLIMSLIVPLNTVPIRHVKSIFNIHSSSTSTIQNTEKPSAGVFPMLRSNSSPLPKSSTQRQLHTKNIQVVTRNDLLNNTYSLGRILSDEETAARKSNGRKRTRRSNSSKKTRSSRSTAKHQDEVDAIHFEAVPAKSRKISEETAALRASGSLSEISVTISDVSQHELYFPTENIKTESISLENRFTKDGELLTIPVHRTITRESESSGLFH